MTNEELEQNIAALQAFRDGKPVEFQHKLYTSKWSDAVEPSWDMLRCNYRPKPEPKTRNWSKPEDVPFGEVWIREIVNLKDRGTHMIVGVHGDGISTGWGRTHYQTLRSYEYSTDGRRTFKPCTVTEA